MILTNTQTTGVISSEQNSNNQELPSILTQDKAHPARSSRYSVVTTIDVLKRFENSGFTWKLLKQEKCRDARAGFGTHLVALEHPEISFRDSLLNQEIKPRLYLKNSYHGGSRFSLDLGIFRFYCENGLFVGMMLESFRKKHIGIESSDIDQVILDMKKSLNERLLPMVQGLAETDMTLEMQMAFAKQALAERLRNNEGFISGEHEKLLITHREQDKGNSTWQVLNRVQENLGLNFRSAPVEVNYSYMGKDKDGNNQVKERKVSKIGRIDEVTQLNKKLFDIVSQHQPSREIKILQAA